MSNPLDHPPTVEQSDEVVDVEALQNGKFLEKIRFVWRREDEEILDRIRAAASEMFEELFGEAVVEVDAFYGSMRVPVQRNGVVQYDAKGRQLWVEDPNRPGKPLERLDQLTGQDIEQALANLQRLKMELALDVNRLKNESVFAKMGADDVKDESWPKAMSGTQGDKAARANRDSRVERYHAFFRYYLWSVADAFFQEIVDFIWRLKDLRNWRIQNQK